MASPSPVFESVVVRAVEGENDVAAFVSFRSILYQNDPNWVGPPDSELVKRLDPGRNPFFATNERELFIARRAGVVVGTIAAIVNDRRASAGGESVGYFGYFETIDDPAVAEKLLAACARWLAERGVTVMRGPVNGSSNDERGVLVEGFARRPALWEGHHPPYYAPFLEGLGMRRQEDVLAYEISYDDLQRDLENLPDALLRVADRARRSGVSLRSPSTKSWADDLNVVYELYVEAHRTIPGHVAMSFELFTSLATAMRPIVDLDLVLILEVDSEPVGLVFALPEIYEALAKVRGDGSRWDQLRLWWQVKRVRSVTVKVIGVLPRARSRGLESVLMLEIAKRIVAKGYERCEMSLVSDANDQMKALLERLGATIYRRYRVFEIDLPLRDAGV